MYRYLGLAQIHVGDPNPDQIGSLKIYGSSRPNLSASHSKWNPSYNKSAGFENTDFDSATL
jgi:hypothetical protein